MLFGRKGCWCPGTWCGPLDAQLGLSGATTVPPQAALRALPSHPGKGTVVKPHRREEQWLRDIFRGSASMGAADLHSQEMAAGSHGCAAGSAASLPATGDARTRYPGSSEGHSGIEAYRRDILMPRPLSWGKNDASASGSPRCSLWSPRRTRQESFSTRLVIPSGPEGDGLGIQAFAGCQ